jgi:hypothetical protein
MPSVASCRKYVAVFRQLTKQPKIFNSAQRLGYGMDDRGSVLCRENDGIFVGLKLHGS